MSRVMKKKIPNELRALISFVNSMKFEFIKTCSDYMLDDIFIKTPSKIFARHLLATRKKRLKMGEFFRGLEKLRRDGDLKERTVKQCRKETIKDDFITGIAPLAIR